VDAACSHNPGIMEYRAVATITGKEIFKMGPFYEGTNNVGEFLALVHALAYLTLKQTEKNKPIFELIERALTWLLTNDSKTRILKWDTDTWGEIPADFGRK